MMRWTGLARCEFEFPFPGGLGREYGIIYAHNGALEYAGAEPKFLTSTGPRCPTEPCLRIKEGDVAKMFEAFIEKRVDKVANPAEWTLAEVPPPPLPPSLPLSRFPSSCPSPPTESC